MLNYGYSFNTDKINKLLKTNLKALLIILFSISFILILLFPVKISAANVAISLSSPASTVQKNAIFKVDVRLSTGSATILDALARVNFNSTQLTLQEVSYSPSSDWGIEGPNAQSGTGYYQIDVITNGSTPSGNLTLVQLTFRALDSNGNTAITISPEQPNITEVGDGTDPVNPHSVTVQGISIKLAPTPSASQPVSPGTVLPQDESGVPARSGGSLDADNNQAEIIDDEAELLALNEENIETSAEVDSRINENLSTFIDSEQKPINTILLFALLGLAIGVLGYIAYIIVKKLKNNKNKSTEETTNKNKSDLDKNEITAEKLKNIKGPDIPDAGSVVEPKNDQK